MRVGDRVINENSRQGEVTEISIGEFVSLVRVAWAPDMQTVSFHWRPLFEAVERGVWRLVGE